MHADPPPVECLPEPLSAVWRAFVARRIPLAIGDLDHVLHALTVVLSPAPESLRAALEAQAAWQAACQAYRQQHRRLPGSDRTTRLRKKRHTRVWQWWLHHD